MCFGNVSISYRLRHKDAQLQLILTKRTLLFLSDLHNQTLQLFITTWTNFLRCSSFLFILLSAKLKASASFFAHSRLLCSFDLLIILCNSMGAQRSKPMKTVYDLVSEKNFLDYKTFLYDFSVLPSLEVMIEGGTREVLYKWLRANFQVKREKTIYHT